nr:hypothetical protein [Yersinia aldovae]
MAIKVMHGQVVIQVQQNNISA